MSEEGEKLRTFHEEKLAAFISRLGWLRIRGLVVGTASVFLACVVPNAGFTIAAAAFGALSLGLAVFSGAFEAFALWLDHRLPRV